MDESVQEQPITTASQPQPPDMTATPEVPETGVKPPRKFPGIVIILLIILVIGGILAYFLFQRLERTKPAATGAQKTTRQSPTPQQRTSHYVGSQTITLGDLTGGLSSGTVTRNITQDNFSFSVNASLPEPLEGQFYQVWVVNVLSSASPVGKLSKNQDNSFSLEASYGVDPSDTFTFSDLYNLLVVTFETADDGVMETKMLEGTFTQ